MKDIRNYMVLEERARYEKWLARERAEGRGPEALVAVAVVRYCRYLDELHGQLKRAPFERELDPSTLP